MRGVEVRSAVALALMLATSLAAISPAASGLRISGARLEPASGVTPGAAVARFGAGESVWLGWSVPAVAAGFRHCCFDGGTAGSCSLAEEHEGWSASDDDAALPHARLVVLARAAAGSVRALRVVSEDCPIEGAGRRVIWLGAQPAGASLDLLESLLEGDEIGERALAAIAAHDAPRVDALLERRAFDRSLSDDEREPALFWAGQARGAAGYRLLDRFLGEEADPDLREHAVFALSQSPVAAAPARIRRVAVEDRVADVRARALFWLAQTDAPGAGEWIVDRLRRESDEDVREQAVFALSQLDDGADWLLRVLRAERDPEIARQALFWLGRSDDPRALEELEKILAR